MCIKYKFLNFNVKDIIVSHFSSFFIITIAENMESQLYDETNGNIAIL